MLFIFFFSTCLSLTDYFLPRDNHSPLCHPFLTPLCFHSARSAVPHRSRAVSMTLNRSLCLCIQPRNRYSWWCWWCWWW